MGDNFFVILTKLLWSNFSSVLADHKNYNVQQRVKIAPSVEMNNFVLPQWALTLQNEMTQVLNHIIFEVELHADFESFRVFVVNYIIALLLVFSTNIFSAIDHEGVIEVKKGTYITCICSRSSIKQYPIHISEEHEGHCLIHSPASDLISLMNL